MTIGHVPIRERLVRPRRQGAPISHILEGETVFPADTNAYLYFYDSNEDALAFWPLTVSGSTVVIDLDSTQWWPYRDSVRSFTVFIEYPDEPGKQHPWFEGAVVRTF